MIDITALNERLVQQDEALRAALSRISGHVAGDPNTSAICELLTEGLAAIHERQGNLITLMLQTNS